MGNKMKKLICTLLASAMLVTSAGMIAFADADTADDTDAEVTETVDTTEDADAEDTDTEDTDSEDADAEDTDTTEDTDTSDDTTTTTTTTSSSDYDDDTYYQKALSLCSALGIISGYEDGSVKPESNVTRAEMASIILRMLNLKSTSTYQNAFTDVDSSHWAADQIQTAMEGRIISGMGDGTFQPDGNVTYAQVMVMLVNALNYTQDAEYNGGWQSGYTKIAAELNLTKNTTGEYDTASDRGTVIKMVYNALLADYKEISSTDDYGNVVYTSKETLSEAKFDLIEAKGTLMATEKTTVSGNEMQEGEIQILDSDNNLITYDCTLTDLEDYLAQSITYYYQENSGLTPEVLAIVYDSSKSEVVDVEADAIESVEDGEVKVEKISKAKDCSSATIIYNGKIATDTEIEEYGGLDEILFPDDYGSLKLIDSDRDGTYDVVFVNNYELMLVTSAGTDRLTGKVSDGTEDDIGSTTALSLNLDDSEDRVITVTRNGATVNIRNLKKNDVATIKRSLDDTVVEVVVTGESITGTASAITKKLDGSHATINGTKYDVANIAVDDLKTSTQCTFYLDMFDRIGYIESSSANGQLQSGESYGWIMNAYESESGDDYLIQMMTTDGEQELKLSTKLEYWAPTATSATNLSGSEVEDTIASLMSSNSFIKASSISTPIRLVKYKTNSAGAITRLYCAVDSDTTDNSDALRIDPTNLNSVAVTGGLVSGYSITDGLLEISVPKNTSDMKDASNYKFGEVSSSVYVVRENGSSRNYVVGEFSSTTTPTLLINFTTASDALADLGDIDTNGNNPVMVVDEIDTGVDDDDNIVYTINGYVNGASASVTTTNNTVLGELNAGATIINSARDYVIKSYTYNGTSYSYRWDARVGDVSGADEDFTDILSEGDLILYDSGERIIKLLDVDDVYETVVNDKTAAKTNSWLFGVFNPFAARNMFVVGGLAEAELDDTSWIRLEDFDVTPASGGSSVSSASLSTISFDSSKLMDTVEINVKSGKASIDTDGSEISDLVIFDEETSTGDYIFARFADKGTLQEIVVYRFTN